ncbi:hypothetical protein NG701_03045 [Pseudarthrobacter sp. HLT3-5]|uniref:hypothetical protein n=1 Tax=Pseudarthrobacter cellobiosi TaxID=2953654 RepID=UPI00208F5882|nr:hypothetical protein [Pseudarthrobacter sp. HLT3-5]MCO4273410.1 hypothetical protein [Pseudarthrobacter sp. HLT3-5]
MQIDPVWMMRMLSSAPDRPNTRSSLRLIPRLLTIDFPRGLLWIVTTLHKFGGVLQESAMVLRFS